jgi:hypothetical protein
MTEEISDYSRSLIVRGDDADIDIYREAGTYGWRLDLKLNGKAIDVPNVFVADKAAYDHAIGILKQRGLKQDMLDADDFGIIDSPLSQRLLVEGHPFEIKIYRGVDEPEWLLEIVNAKGTSIVPDQRFKSDQDALGAALADFENKPIEEFLG